MVWRGRQRGAGDEENEPVDANVDPATARARGDIKVAEAIPRRSVVFCQWPAVTAVQILAALPPQCGHPAPPAASTAERSRVSPRQRAAPGRARVSFACGASALQQAALPR
mmetsp:Transcript_15591/g.46731  ORF Transcript_15591/g.46731 Transcript_15591/m.46731 type:complete len:111 (-) Transcript_15591:87-419(-)